MRDQIDYWANKAPICPHCDTDFDLCRGDRHLEVSYEDGGKATFTCSHCQKDFVCVTIVNYVYSTAVSEEAADNEEWGPQESETA